MIAAVSKVFAFPLNLAMDSLAMDIAWMNNSKGSKKGVQESRDTACSIILLIFAWKGMPKTRRKQLVGIERLKLVRI